VLVTLSMLAFVCLHRHRGKKIIRCDYTVISKDGKLLTAFNAIATVRSRKMRLLQLKLVVADQSSSPHPSMAFL